MAGTDEWRLNTILAAAQAGHPAGESFCRLVLNILSPVQLRQNYLKVFQLAQVRTVGRGAETVSSNVRTRTEIRS